MPRSLLLAALAVALALPLAAQPVLDGVMLGPTGPAPAGNAISLFNPDAAALHRVGVTINTYQSHGVGGRADTLGTRVRPQSGFGIQHHASYNAALSAQGRLAFIADWFGPDQQDVQVMAVDRDGRNISVLTEPIRLNLSLGGTRARPDISTDGQTVLYTVSGGTPDTLWTVPSDGSAAPTVFPFTPLTACEQGAARAAFSPDGSEIAYLGWMEVGTGPDATCELALRAVSVDGATDRVVFGPLNRGFDEDWFPTEIALDWKADRILFNWPTRRVGAGSSLARRVSVVRVTSGEILHEVSELADVSYDSYQLSPDGRSVGYLKYQHPGNHWVEVRRLANDALVLDLEAVYQHGARPFFDWADAPPVPEPSRLVIRRDVMLWFGREVNLAPRLLDADGNVISYVVDTWSYERGAVPTTWPTINHFTNRIWAAFATSGGNGFDNQVCAQQAGLETCRTHNTVNTPIFDIEVLDDDIAEAGRNPGRFRVYRYGPPGEPASPQLQTSRTAVHYLDYTLSSPPGAYRWAGSPILADTLQVRDVTLTPIDDAVAEPEIEEGDLVLQCDSSPNEANSNCAAARPGQIPGVVNGIGLPSATSQLRWRFEIQSNGAGAGVGIASSRPQRASNQAPATLVVLGQGFGEDAVATLSGPATLTADVTRAFENGARLRAAFDLEGAPTGTYALTVTSGGASSTLQGALVVEAVEPTVQVWTSMINNSLRVGFPRTLRVVYGNDGNSDAVMVPIRVAFPWSTEVTVQNEFYNPVLENEIDQDLIWIRETIQPAEICPPTSPAGAPCPTVTPMDARIAVFYIPVIPAGSSGELLLSVAATAPMANDNWSASAGRPLNTLDWDALTGEGLVQTGDFAVVCDASRSEAAVNEGLAACVLCLQGLFSELLPDSCIGDAFKTAIAFGNAALAATTGEGAVISGYSLGAQLIETAVSCGAIALPGGQVIAAGFTLYELFTSINKLAGIAQLAKNCSDCSRYIVSDWLGLAQFWSFDPNEKTGHIGIGPERYVASFGRIPYVISFENLSTATASAVEVTITDTLDVATLDLSTFSLGTFVLPDTSFTAPAGLAAWTTYWDRRPSEPSLVRLDAALDVETGVVLWQMSDLDPTDYTLRTSAEAGFLPPNGANGEGEGSVTFTIAAKPGLPDGTTIGNRADSRFHRNELIDTGVWANTLDLSSPVSAVVSADPGAADTLTVVRFEGTDGGSGVGRYDLFAQANGGPFEKVATVEGGDEVVFQTVLGTTYGVFALATDRVGNAEAPKTVAELTFVAGQVAAEGESSLPTELALASPYPNPTRGPVVLQVGVPQAGAVRVTVYDLRGREVAVVVDGPLAAGWQALRWDAAGLASGLYVVRAEGGGQEATQRISVVR